MPFETQIRFDPRGLFDVVDCQKSVNYLQSPTVLDHGAIE